MDLNWSASDNTGISYYVLKEGSSEIYRGSNTTKELEGLVSGNNYTLTVYAYDAAGNSNTSSVSFTTLGSSTSTTTTTTTTSTTTTTVPQTTTTTIGPYDTAQGTLTEPYIISYNLVSVSEYQACVSFEFGGTQAVRYRILINDSYPWTFVSVSGNKVYSTGYAQIGDQGSSRDG